MKKNINSSRKFAIEVKKYSKNFGKLKVVENASFGVSHGKIHGFIGPNGAGKTTTIKAMIGAFHKSQGEILIEGFPSGSVKAKKMIGYIPERASFSKSMNCMEYLIFMAKLSGMNKKGEAKAKALSILKELNLLEHKFRKPHKFSSGMKKKILIAQAMMTNPTILILDEPAANLDPTARKEMFEMFKKIVKQGCSILISSHILAELQSIIDEVTFITQGKIKYTGNISGLITDNGILVSFTSPLSTISKNIIKKYKMYETVSGWKVTTKNHATTLKLAKEIIVPGSEITSISFLNSNLSSAYDKFIEQDDIESNTALLKKRG